MPSYREIFGEDIAVKEAKPDGAGGLSYKDVFGEELTPGQPEATEERRERPIPDRLTLPGVASFALDLVARGADAFSAVGALPALVIPPPIGPLLAGPAMVAPAVAGAARAAKQAFVSKPRMTPEQREMAEAEVPEAEAGRRWLENAMINRVARSKALGIDVYADPKYRYMEDAHKALVDLTQAVKRKPNLLREFREGVTDDFRTQGGFLDWLLPSLGLLPGGVGKGAGAAGLLISGLSRLRAEATKLSIQSEIAAKPESEWTDEERAFAAAMKAQRLTPESLARNIGRGITRLAPYGGEISTLTQWLGGPLAAKLGLGKLGLDKVGFWKEAGQSAVVGTTNTFANPFNLAELTLKRMAPSIGETWVDPETGRLVAEFDRGKPFGESLVRALGERFFEQFGEQMAFIAARPLRALATRTGFTKALGEIIDATPAANNLKQWIAALAKTRYGEGAVLWARRAGYGSAEGDFWINQIGESFEEYFTEARKLLPFFRERGEKFPWPWTQEGMEFLASTLAVIGVAGPLLAGPAAVASVKQQREFKQLTDRWGVKKIGQPETRQQDIAATDSDIRTLASKRYAYLLLRMRGDPDANLGDLPTGEQAEWLLEYDKRHRKAQEQGRLWDVAELADDEILGYATRYGLQLGEKRVTQPVFVVPLLDKDGNEVGRRTFASLDDAQEWRKDQEALAKGEFDFLAEAPKPAEPSVVPPVKPEAAPQPEAARRREKSWAERTGERIEEDVRQWEEGIVAAVRAETGGFRKPGEQADLRHAILHGLEQAAKIKRASLNPAAVERAKAGYVNAEVQKWARRYGYKIPMITAGARPAPTLPAVEFVLSGRAKQSGKQLVEVDVAKLDRVWMSGPGRLYTERGGKGPRDEAYQKSRRNLEAGRLSTAPEVDLAAGVARFTRGGERFAAWRDLGAKTATVAVPASQVEAVRQAFGIEGKAPPGQRPTKPSLPPSPGRAPGVQREPAAPAAPKAPEEKPEAPAAEAEVPTEEKWTPQERGYAVRWGEGDESAERTELSRAEAEEAALPVSNDPNLEVGVYDEDGGWHDLTEEFRQAAAEEEAEPEPEPAPEEKEEPEAEPETPAVERVGRATITREDNEVRLRFDVRPNADIRDELKRRGGWRFIRDREGEGGMWVSADSPENMAFAQQTAKREAELPQDVEAAPEAPASEEAPAERKPKGKKPKAVEPLFVQADTWDDVSALFRDALPAMSPKEQAAVRKFLDSGKVGDFLNRYVVNALSSLRVFIPADSELGEALWEKTKPDLGHDKDSRAVQIFATCAQQGVMCDGHMLITDPAGAKAAIAYFEPAVRKAATANKQDYDEEAKEQAPDFKRIAVDPQNVGPELRVTGYLFGIDGRTHVVLTDGKSVRVTVDAAFLKTFERFVPGAVLHRQVDYETGDPKRVSLPFLKNGAVVGLVMPFRFGEDEPVPPATWKPGDPIPPMPGAEPAEPAAEPEVEEEPAELPPTPEPEAVEERLSEAETDALLSQRGVREGRVRSLLHSLVEDGTLPTRAKVERVLDIADVLMANDPEVKRKGYWTALNEAVQFESAESSLEQSAGEEPGEVGEVREPGAPYEAGGVSKEARAKQILEWMRKAGKAKLTVAPAPTPAKPAEMSVEEKAVRHFDGNIPESPRAAMAEALDLLGDDPDVDVLWDAIETAGNLAQAQMAAETPGSDNLAERLKAAFEFDLRLPTRTAKTVDIGAPRLQQFSTPGWLAELMSRLADTRQDDRVLEPTAGTGSLLAPFFPEASNPDARISLSAIEVDPRRVAMLRALAAIAAENPKRFGGTATPLTDIRQGDYLAAKVNPTVIVANPPWGTTTKPGQGVPADLPFPANDYSQRFVFKFLNDLPVGGRLVVLLPRRTLDNAAFLKWLEKEHTPIARIFFSSRALYRKKGANVEALVLVVDKGKFGREVPDTWQTKIFDRLDPNTLADYAQDVTGAAPREEVEYGPVRPAVEPGAGVTPAGPPTRAPEAGQLPGAVPRPQRPPGGLPRPGQSAVAGPGRPGAGPGRVPVSPVATVEMPAERREARRLTPEEYVSHFAPRVPADLRDKYLRQLAQIVGSGVYVPYQPSIPGWGVSPHPSPVVEPVAYRGAQPRPDVNRWKLGPGVTRAWRELVDSEGMPIVSDVQAEMISLGCLVNVLGTYNRETGAVEKHGILFSLDVGTGKSRILAGTTLDLFESGHGKVFLLTTASPRNFPALKQQFDLVAGGTFPIPIVEAGVYNTAANGKSPTDLLEALPKNPDGTLAPVVVLAHAGQLAQYREALLHVPFDVVVGDEAHTYKNLLTSQAAGVWTEIHRGMIDRLGEGAKFIYSTATPGVGIEQLEYLWGLREWPLRPGGFDDWVLWVTGYKARPSAAEPVQGGEGEQTQEQQEADSSEISPLVRKPKGWRQAGDAFAIGIPPRQAEQLIRELASDGKYATAALWLEGVEYREAFIEMSPKDIEEHDALVGLIREIHAAFDFYGGKNEGPKKILTNRAWTQAFLDQWMFIQKLKKVLPMVEKSLADGAQPVISIVNVNPTNMEAGNLAAAINAINTHEVVKEEQELVDMGEIPEAVAKKAELFDRATALGLALPDPVQMVVDHFGKDKVAIITGNVSQGQAESMRQDFQAGKRPILVVSPAGKTGLDIHHTVLTKGGAQGRRHVFGIQYEWSIDKVWQGNGRFTRTGAKTQPIFSVVHRNTGVERKRLGALQVRATDAGASWRGSSETRMSAFDDFDVSGPAARAAMHTWWLQADEETRDWFQSWPFRDHEDPTRPCARLRKDITVNKFLLELESLPYEVGLRIANEFVETRRAIIESNKDFYDLRSQLAEGEVTESLALADDLELFVMKTQATGKEGKVETHKYGVLRGTIRHRAASISRILNPTRNVEHRLLYITVRTPQGPIAGMKIPAGRIAQVARLFGKQVASARITPAIAIEELSQGRDVALRNGWRLHMRPSDKKIAIVRPPNSDKSVPGVYDTLVKLAEGGRRKVMYGAAYNPHGNYFSVPATAEAMSKFLHHFPAVQPGEAAGAKAAEVEGLPVEQAAILERLRAAREKDRYDRSYAEDMAIRLLDRDSPVTADVVRQRILDLMEGDADVTKAQMSALPAVQFPVIERVLTDIGLSEDEIADMTLSDAADAIALELRREEDGESDHTGVTGEPTVAYDENDADRVRDGGVPYDASGAEHPGTFSVRLRNAPGDVTYMLANEVVRTPDDAAAVMYSLKGHFSNVKEHAFVILLDGADRALGVAYISTGGQDATMAHAREVLTPAYLAGAEKIIFVHNHPSGNTQPSPLDRRLVAYIRQRAGEIGVALAGHIITNGDNYTWVNAQGTETMFAAPAVTGQVERPLLEITGEWDTDAPQRRQLLRPEDVQLFVSRLTSPDKPTTLAIFLNGNSWVNGVRILSDGPTLPSNLGQAIAESALKHNANRIILVTNLPYDDVRLQIQKLIVDDQLRAVGIPFVDVLTGEGTPLGSGGKTAGQRDLASWNRWGVFGFGGVGSWAYSVGERSRTTSEGAVVYGDAEIPSWFISAAVNRGELPEPRDMDDDLFAGVARVYKSVFPDRVLNRRHTWAGIADEVRVALGERVLRPPAPPGAVAEPGVRYAPRDTGTLETDVPRDVYERLDRLARVFENYQVALNLDRLREPFPNYLSGVYLRKGARGQVVWPAEVGPLPPAIMGVVPPNWSVYKRFGRRWVWLRLDPKVPDETPLKIKELADLLDQVGGLPKLLAYREGRLNFGVPNEAIEPVEPEVLAGTPEDGGEGENQLPDPGEPDEDSTPEAVTKLERLIAELNLDFADALTKDEAGWFDRVSAAIMPTIERGSRRLKVQDLWSKLRRAAKTNPEAARNFGRWLREQYGSGDMNHLSEKDLNDVVLLAEMGHVPGLEGTRVAPPTRTPPPDEFEGDMPPLDAPKRYTNILPVLDDFRRMGPFGKALANMVDMFWLDSDRRQGEWIQRMNDIRRELGSFKTGDWVRYMAWVLGAQTAEEVGMEEARLVRTRDRLKALNDDVLELGQKLNVKTETRLGIRHDLTAVEDFYWHRRYDLIRGKAPKYHDQIGVFLKHPDPEVRGFAAAWDALASRGHDPLGNPTFFDRAVVWIVEHQGVPEPEARLRLLGAREDLKSSPFGALERSREVDLPVFRLDPGVEATYLVGAARRTSWLQHFGENYVAPGRGAAPYRIRQIISHIPGKINQDFAFAFFQRTMLHHFRNVDRDFARALAAWRTANVIKLGLSALPNSLQSFTNTLQEVGIWSYVQGVANVAAGYAEALVTRKQPDILRFVRSAGATSDMSVMQLAEATSGGWLGRWATRYLKACLFMDTETNNRFISALAGTHRAKQLFNRLAKHPSSPRADYYRDLLREMHVDLDEAVKRGHLSESDFQGAAWAVTRITQFMSRPGYRPMWWDTDVAKTVLQFKFFAYSQSVLMGRSLKRLVDWVSTGGKRGSPVGFFQFLAAAAVAGWIVQNLRDWVLRRKRAPGMPDSWILKMLIYAMNVGGFGLAFDGIMSVVYGDTSIYRLVGGPSLADVVETALLVYNAPKKLLQGRPHEALLDVKHYAAGRTPVARLMLQALDKQYRQLDELRTFRRAVLDARGEYKRRYDKGGASAAKAYWQTVRDQVSPGETETWAERWKAITGKTLTPPTAAEVRNWQEDRFDPAIERLRRLAPGRKPRPGKREGRPSSVRPGGRRGSKRPGSRR